MEFEYSPQVLELRQRLEEFIDHYVLPYNAAWHRSVAQGVYPPPPGASPVGARTW